MELCTLQIKFAVNPFGKNLPDKIVREKFKQYSGKWDTDLENTGLPDKFSPGVCQGVSMEKWQLHHKKG